MTSVELKLPASNWTSLVFNLSLNHILNNRGGQGGGGQVHGLDYGNIHDLHHSSGGSSSNSNSGGNDGVIGLDRGGSPPAYHRPKHGDDDWGSCRDWQDAQHTLFQLANVCAAVSVLTPTSFRHHLLFLRCLLLVAFLFFVLWAGLFVCMLDVLVWNCVFFLIDLVHIVSLAYNSIPVRIVPSLCDLYAKRFKPLRVTRKEFADLCSLAHIVSVRKGTRYALEGVTSCGDKVSILIRGRLKVTHDDVFLHCVQPNEFVDSIEFDSIPVYEETTEKFQVTVVASEDSLVLSWLYPTLQGELLEKRHFLWAVFRGLVGKDVSDKLYKIQELLLKETETMLDKAPPTPRPPALMHKTRRPGPSSSPSLLTPRHSSSFGAHGYVPRRLSSHADLNHVTEVPRQTTLNPGESFV